MQESIIKTMKLSRWVVTLSLIYYFTCFVLFLNDGYSNVLTLRYQLFWIAGIITIGLTVLCSVIERKKSQEAEKTRIHLETYEIAIFAFLAACILSTVFSDYKYEAVWGNEGRLCGLFFLSICCFLYLIISRKLYFKTWLIDLFLFSSMLACIWGITDFFQLDIFNLKEGFYIVDKYNFVSSIGNVNTYTAFLAFKWEFRRMTELPILGERIGSGLRELAERSGLNELELDRQKAVIMEICAQLKGELQRQGLSDSDDWFLASHGESVQSRIGDVRLRSLPVQFE